MKLVNIIFDERKKDVAIISVPDYVHDNLELTVQNFFNWLDSTHEHGYYVSGDNGTEYLEIGVNEFVKWLNDNSVRCASQKALVIEEFAKYNPKYPSARF
jgi:hypothetical protein